MKYLVTVVQGITVTADSPKEAEAQGLAMCDGGRGRTTRREETGEMSYHEYVTSALIMAAMRQADDANTAKLRAAWPEVWDELYARYHAPGGVLEGESVNV